MICANKVLGVFLFIIFNIVDTDAWNESDYRVCTREVASCVFASSCRTLNYNFTSLSEDERNLHLKGNICNEVGNEPLICCSETDTPDRRVCGFQPDDQKILGGHDAQIDDYTWMVLLEHKSGNNPNIEYRCAGSLINNRYVLTAAHCLKYSDQLTHVLLGKYDSNKTENCDADGCYHPTLTVGIEEKIAHEQYDSTTKANDIALIRLSTIVHYTDFIKPICLPWTWNYTSSDNATRELGGWGKGAKTTRKQKTFVPLNDFEYCKEKFRQRSETIRPDYKTQICAGNVPSRGTCAGDSGGPLMTLVNSGKGKLKYVIEGIISNGYDICDNKTDESYPIIFTKVLSYKSWIQSKIRD